MEYKGQVIDRMSGEIVCQTRWYTTWESAHHHVDIPKWKADRYSLKVIERVKEK